MLAERVARGELPPVAERLPQNPRVLPVYERIGQYGGTWRRAYTGLGDRWGLTKLIEERPVEFYLSDAETLSIELNWVDRFEISADASEYVFHIREGLKWSDGVAVTTEDVRFWYEAVFLNKNLTPAPREHLRLNGHPLEIEILDTYTFKAKFSAPYPFFPEVLSKLGTLDTKHTLHGTSFIMPAHYLKRFHPDYALPHALAAAVAEKNVAHWTDLWGAGGPITSWWLNPDLPVITAWMITEPPPAKRIVMRRNPYYFAVDPAGNQLPYIDEIVHVLLDEPKDLALLAVQGQLDMQDRHIQWSDYTFLKHNEVLGDYRVMPWVESGAGLFINLNTENAALAQLFGERRFRQALSIALNRQEINEVVFNGLGVIQQAGPMTSSPHFDPEFAQRWIEYDPETANALLDELGLGQRNAQGWRLDAAGEPLQISITYPNYLYGDLITDLIRRHWQAIGIKIHWDLVERSVFEQRVADNDVEVTLYLYSRTLTIPPDPTFFLGVAAEGTWMPRWSLWYTTSGLEGIEPPVDHPIREVWATWAKAQTAPNRTEAHAFVHKMIDIHKEHVWVIGVVAELPVPVIVRNNFRNVPEFGVAADELRGTGSGQPAQFFFTQP